MKFKHLSQVDSEIASYIEQERLRQENGLELIASENYTSCAVMEAQGSILTNKYAEGLPRKRYYGGCEFVDLVEQVCIDRVKKLFGANFANVQPHSGSQANMAVYLASLTVGDTILGMDLAQGGHLTHGGTMNFSGKLFRSVFYGVRSDDERLDYDQVMDVAKRERPKMIVAGASAYPRLIDFKKFKEIADAVGALLMVDMAHIAGLVAARIHPDPVEVADFVTSTTHKTLRGPRGGLILFNNADWEKKINGTVFPGIQGGPLEHVIAGKAVAFKEALDDSFITYQKQVVTNAKVLGNELQKRGLPLVSGGTDNHLILVKMDTVSLSGKEAEKCLEEVGITCNKNMIPGDKRSPLVTSGIRLGTPAMTTRGMKEGEMMQLAEWITSVLKNASDEGLKKKVKSEVLEMCQQFPVYSK